MAGWAGGVKETVLVLDMNTPEREPVTRSHNLSLTWRCLACGLPKEGEGGLGELKALPAWVCGRTKEAALALSGSTALNSHCERMGLPGYYFYFVVQIWGTNII